MNEARVRELCSEVLSTLSWFSAVGFVERGGASVVQQRQPMSPGQGPRDLPGGLRLFESVVATLSGDGEAVFPTDDGCIVVVALAQHKGWLLGHVRPFPRFASAMGVLRRVASQIGALPET
jgi:hypothetical protein